MDNIFSVNFIKVIVSTFYCPLDVHQLLRPKALIEK